MKSATEQHEKCPCGVSGESAAMRSAPLSGHPAIPSSLCGGRQQVLLCVYFTPPKRSRELFHVVQFCSALIDRWGGGSTESACSSSPSPPASSVSHRYVNVFKTRGRPIRRNRVRSQSPASFTVLAGSVRARQRRHPSDVLYPTGCVTPHTRVCVFQSSELHVCLPGRPSGECESRCVMGLFLNYLNISSPKGLVHHVA